MLINQLPEDSTPSPLGMVPYSEDGVHLNFITIESLMGYGGGDGGGGGGFTEIEFPDGSKGYYVREATNVFTEQMIQSGQAFSGIQYTAAQINNFPDKFFSEYVRTAADGNWIYSDSGGASYSNISVLDIDDITYNTKNSVTIHWKNTNKDYGFIPNSNYDSRIKENFPFIFASCYETIANWTRNPLDDDQTHIAEPYIEQDMKMPVLYMLYSSGIDAKINDEYSNIGEVVYPASERKYRTEVGGQEHIWVEPIDILETDGMRISKRFNSSDGILLPPGEGTYEYDFILNGVGFKLAKTANFIQYFKDFMCDDYWQTSDENPHITNRYSIGKAVVNNSTIMDYYDSQDVNLHIQLWDRFYIYGPLPNRHNYGLLCHHIINSEGNEYWIFNKGQGTSENIYAFSDWNEQRTALVPGGDLLCPLLFDIPIPSTVPTDSSGEREMRLTINESYITNDDYAPYFLHLSDIGYTSTDRNPLVNSNSLVYDTEYEANAAAFTVAFGLKMESFVSTLITSDHAYAQLAPTKKKRLWNWNMPNNGTVPSYRIPYKSDGYYGGRELIKYAAFSMNAFYSPYIDDRYRDSAGNSMTFGIPWYEESPYTLRHLINASGGGGGGSDLPDVTSSDEGKVLGVKYSSIDSDYIWDKIELPTYFYGHIDGGSSTINSWSDVEHRNSINVGNGLRAKYNVITGHNYMQLYADPSAMGIGDYVDISSAKTGGFGVTKTPDSNTGITNYTLDILDIDKFQQIVGGTGIQVTSAKNSSTNVRTYTIAATNQYNHLATNLNQAYKNNVHIESGAWRTLNTYAGGGSYHPSYWELDTDSVYYIDVGLTFDVPANIAAGSYARLILSTFKDEDGVDGSNIPYASRVLYSNQGEMGNIGRSSIFEETKLLIPGVANTLHFSGLVTIGSNNLNNQLYFNMYHNAGVSLGYDMASSSPTVQLPIKLSGFAFKC